MKIQIEPYNPDWQRQFEQLKTELSIIFNQLSPTIEHIGSTSVSGLAAKPFIDIMVGLKSVDELDKTIEPMRKTGKYIYYEVYNNVMPQRRLFVRLKEEVDIQQFQSVYTSKDIIPHEVLNACRWAHVHVWELNSPDWLRHIAFREYLKTHPEVKNQYESLKRALSQQNWKDGNEYNAGKDSFIKREEAKAIEWYKQQKS